MNSITHGGRTFLALRKAGHRSRTSGPVYHAVTPGYRRALGSAEPGAGSDWAAPPAEHVTSPVGMRRLARLGAYERG